VLAAHSDVTASITPDTTADGNVGVPVTADHAYTVDTTAPTAVSMSASTTSESIALFNTGVDSTGKSLAAGATDTHYQLISEPSGATFTSAVTVSQQSASSVAWATTDYATSEWLGSIASNPKTGTFKYQTTFNLDSTVDLSSVDIQFNINADDNVAILVNGVSTGINLTSLWTSGSTTHVDLSSLNSLFQVGTNTIEFDITNSGSGPTGLKIDNMVASVLSHDLPITINFANTGAVAGDTLNFTANVGGVVSTQSHVLTAADISLGHLVEHETLTSGNSVSTYVASVTDAAGNQSTIATETVVGSGNLSVTAATVGAEVFKWTLDSHGTVANPAKDTVNGFNSNDVLDLRDLLQGESHTGNSAGNLSSYLNFTYDSVHNTTTINVSSHANGTTGVDQIITVSGNLVNGATTNDQIIQNLLTSGKLITD